MTALEPPPQCPPQAPRRAPALPAAAGPISDALLGAIARPDGAASPAGAGATPERVMALVPARGGAALADDDFQLALYVMYELHYRGFDGVAEEWEWNPSLLALRAALERRFMDELVELVGAPLGVVAASQVDVHLRAIVDGDRGPSLSRYLEARASLAEFLEFVIHRSAYQLKEADPHSWAIPRLAGPPKGALVEIQSDEYGEGEPHAIHAELFCQTMLALGLDGTYGAYLNRIPGVTLATVNLMSMFGLHRRWRGALVGHLAAFEMSSPLPNRRYSNALLRLGAPERARAFYDVHVVADAVHEQVAGVDLAGGLIEQEPQLGGDVLFGARALVALESAFAGYVLERWAAGRSSLRCSPVAGAETPGEEPGTDGAAPKESGAPRRSVSGALGAQKPIVL